MFIKSAAEGLQSKAIHQINIRWGEDVCGRHGRETIGIPVCKKKYSPFLFRNKDGTITVERMFGCHVHHGIRKKTIEQHGCRPGWEPFGQWSMRKALEQARAESERLNSSSPVTTTADDECSSSSDEDAPAASNLSICHHGKCAWKRKEKYDDIHSELRDQSEEEQLIYAKHYPAKSYG
jgi:hypothetical protein